MRIIWLTWLNEVPVNGVYIGETEEALLSCGERVAIPAGGNWTSSEVKELVAMLAAEAKENLLAAVDEAVSEEKRRQSEIYL